MTIPLYQSYKALDPTDRFIVQLFSLLYRPISRLMVCRCFNAARQKSKLDPFTHSQFDDRIRKLLQAKVLKQEQGLGVICEDSLQEIVVRDACQGGTFPAIVQGIRSVYILQGKRSGALSFDSESEFVQDLRIAIYQQDLTLIDRILDSAPKGIPQVHQYFNATLHQMLTNPFDRDWIEGLKPDFQERALQGLLDYAVQQCLPLGEAFEILENRFQQGIAQQEQTGLVYVEQLWLQGYIEEASVEIVSLLPGDRYDRRCALLGAMAVLKGRAEEALAHYREGLKAAGKTQKAKIHWFVHYPGSLLYFFAALKEGSVASLQEAQKYAEILSQTSNFLSGAMQPLLSLLYQQQGNLTQLQDGSTLFMNYALQYEGIPGLLVMYCLYWLNVPQAEEWLLPQVLQQFKSASKAGYGWLAGEIATLISELEDGDRFREIADSLRAPHCVPLIHTVQHQPLWALSLQALTQLTEPTKPETPTSSHRMVWRISLQSKHYWSIAPLEQKMSKGGWTKGKPIALKRLNNGGTPAEFPYMTDQDRRICRYIEAYQETSYRYYGGTTTYQIKKDAILALVGHPHVYWEDTPTVRVEVVTGEPELVVKEKDNKLHLQFVPNLSNAEHWLVVKETPTRLKVITVGRDHRRIAELLGPQNCLSVPLTAKEQVLTAIAALSTLVTIQSDIGGGVAAEEVSADPTPRLHLIPAGEGLKASILVHPFAEGGSYYLPGQGGATVIAEVEGKRLQTQRNLTAEKERAKAIQKNCSVLNKYKATKGEWHIEDPEDCLELLLELQNLGDQVQIEWPQGEKFRVSRSLGFGDFKLQIKQQQDWFAASGEVQVSETEVLDLRQLLGLLEASPGKFIKLSDGQFLALTEAFRKRLQTLSRLTETTRKGLRVNAIAALSLEDVLADVDQLKVDKAWKENLKRIKAAQQIEPQIPNTLEATLRDYQIDGYRWLARLAQWGVGACLADDMGLGKTIQVLTVILSRAEQGPTLVIAPTSVGMNWISESERFAPCLNVKVFGSGDRQKMLDEVTAYDLVVCSYGLLQQDEVAEKLAQVTWNTIVLDEAQAIKNAATKRSQAAMALQGNFKIITTGTPIENHLGELWNLFRFINPGLLGSLDSFNERFAYPIERDQNDGARDALRRLIQPFILRRTKAQVLTELPERTEITLQVELSSEEMAFYEALRRESLEKLTNTDASAGAKHLQVLAEIMRLRRACCNPRLVRPELSLPSAKLDQFSEVLEELLDSGHKALVFSQFVDHLTILREYLDQQQIRYQYLDGSTPTKQRKQRVDAFQNGDGEVFLISLKAGGTGLNLTAADYVIHMDPWWNPAVEDQASDRAHRIGQQRPVTIYRLVAKGTIEDKIVALHQSKRDLADSLLEGADMSGKISTDELIALLSQG